METERKGKEETQFYLMYLLYCTYMSILYSAYIDVEIKLLFL